MTRATKLLVHTLCLLSSISTHSSLVSSRMEIIPECVLCTIAVFNYEFLLYYIRATREWSKVHWYSASAVPAIKIYFYSFGEVGCGRSSILGACSKPPKPSDFCTTFSGASGSRCPRSLRRALRNRVSDIFLQRKLKQPHTERRCTTARCCPHSCKRGHRVHPDQ